MNTGCYQRREDSGWFIYKFARFILQLFTFAYTVSFMSYFS